MECNSAYLVYTRVCQLGVGLLAVTIWLEFCLSYGFSCYHHLNQLNFTLQSEIETFWYRLTQVHLEMAVKTDRDPELRFFWAQSHTPIPRCIRKEVLEMLTGLVEIQTFSVNCVKNQFFFLCSGFIKRKVSKTNKVENATWRNSPRSTCAFWLTSTSLRISWSWSSDTFSPDFYTPASFTLHISEHMSNPLHRIMANSQPPCGLRGCKNRPAPFPGRMS